MLSGIDRILAGCAPASRAGAVNHVDPSSLELPEGEEMVERCQNHGSHIIGFGK